MKKLIFGAACMIAGLLLVIIMLLIGAYPNAIGSLNPLGQMLVWVGVLASIAGFIYAVFNLSDKK